MLECVNGLTKTTTKKQSTNIKLVQIRIYKISKDVSLINNKNDLSLFNYLSKNKKDINMPFRSLSGGLFVWHIASRKSVYLHVFTY